MWHADIPPPDVEDGLVEAKQGVPRAAYLGEDLEEDGLEGGGQAGRPSIADCSDEAGLEEGGKVTYDRLPQHERCAGPGERDGLGGGLDLPGKWEGRGGEWGWGGASQGL